jgi:hypothetical protein
VPILKISFGNRSQAMVSYLFKQTQDGMRVQALGGNVVGRDADTVEREFRETRTYFGQQEGRQYYHVALSFERADLGDLAGPSGKPDYEKIRDYGDQWAKESGVADRHEYVVVVHGEKEHPHAHVVWNATGLDGRKYHNDRHNLNRLRDVNDVLARRHGIQRELDRVRDPHRPPDKFLRRVQRGGGRYSWRMDMQGRIREAARRSLSEDDFTARLRERGVALRIRGGKYSYSMNDVHGKQRVCRELRLGEGFHRDSLLDKFERQREQLRSDPDGYRKRLGLERTERYTWQRDLRARIIEALRNARSHEAFRNSMEKQRVSAHLAKDGLYRFAFTDRHGLRHEDISAARLDRGATDRITARISENAARNRTFVATNLARTAGREAGGLVAQLLPRIEAASRGQRSRGEGGLPTREDLRMERTRRREMEGDHQESW